MGRRGRTIDLRMHRLVIACLSALVVLSKVHPTEAEYKIGVGRADCTGPSVEVIFVSILLPLSLINQLAYSPETHLFIIH